MTSVVRPDAGGAYLRGLLGVEFTDAQLAIATHELAPQLVVAGAGSGKTTVMAARVVHAVAYQGIAPGRVLGLTFTNKAAGELATRVRKSLAKLPSTVDPGDELPTVTTYHAYAAGIVRDHALRIGREPYAALLSEASAWQLAMRVVRRARGPFRHLPWTPASVAAKMLALSGEIAEHLADPDEVRAVDAAIASRIDMTRARKAVRDLVEVGQARDELLRLVEDYRRAKEQLDLIDYGDQVALAAQIARTAPAVGALERSRASLVVLDEYQDTGVAQRVLLATLFGDGHPVTAVGDPHQAIYGWRGASVGNLLRFGTHFPRADGRDATPQPLMTSFRCGGRILGAANRVVDGLGEGFGDSRRPKLAVPRLSARPSADEAGDVVLARLDTDEAEARWLARQLATELDKGTPAGEMAVLARRRTDFARLHRALIDHDVPVEVVGLGGLLEMPEVADVVAVLSLLVDPTANAAAIRVLTGPRWRIGVRDLAALGRRAARLATWSGEEPGHAAGGSGVAAALRQVTDAADPVDVASLLDAIDSPGPPEAYSEAARERLTALRDELHLLRGLVGQPLVELVTEVVHTIGLDVEIEAEVERVAVARAANLAAFVDHAARFTGLDGESDLPAFLAFLAAAADADDGLDVGAVSSADTVKLMTVHKAKGLEWDVVAVPGLVSDVFPAMRGRTPWTKGAHVLPFPVRGDCDDLPVLDALEADALDRLHAQCRADDRDEERRLAYVAFTRPRRVLLASGYCWSGTRVGVCAPSPYLAELRELVDAGTAIVDEWCDDPPDDATNPLAVARTTEVRWPAIPDATRAERRRRAADRVLAAIDAPAASVQEGLELRLGGELDRAEETRLVLDELQAERAGVREVPLPRRLTASQVVALARDPQELAQSLARPMPVRPRPQARRGSRFHRWVEQLYDVTTLLDPDDLPGAGDADLDDAELAELQEKFVAAGWADRRPVAVEQPFELVVGGRLIRGRIDAVYPSADGDGFEVIDFKTGDVATDFAAASLQLSVYRLAWADLAGVDPEQVEAGFLYVRTGEVRRPGRLLDRDALGALLGG